MKLNRRRSARVALGLAMCAATLAAVAGTAAEAAVVTDKSIDGIALGFTKARVIERWGKPKRTFKDLRSIGGHKRETVLFYKKRKRGQDKVVLFKGRVIEVMTFSGAQKTPEGIGPGSSLEEVDAAYPQGFSPKFGAFDITFPSVQLEAATDSDPYTFAVGA